MKAKSIPALWLAAFLLLTLCACGEKEREMEDLRARLEEAQTALDEADALLSGQSAELEEKNVRIAELNARIDGLEEQVRELEGDTFGLAMWWAEPDMEQCILYPDRDGFLYLYESPDREGPYQPGHGRVYAEVLARTQIQDMLTGIPEDWYLVKFSSFSAESGTMGWVPRESLEEYTWENRESISGPLGLREGALLYGDRDCTTERAESNMFAVCGGKCYVMQHFPDGITQISYAEFTAYVYTADLVYPEPKV